MKEAVMPDSLMLTKAAIAKPVAISAEGVWKVFGDGAKRFSALPSGERTPDALAKRHLTAAVRDANFEILQGEVFVIMGLSGSGKSTLLRCLTRLNDPTEGKIKFDGRDILDLGDKDLVDLRRTRMGMVFQHFALLPNRTVVSNIAFPLEVQGMAQKEGRHARFPSELSGGQQQRVGIARSLATNPEFWFLDEPFSALDPLIRADLQTEVLRLQKTQVRTAVFVTHDLDEAICLADRIAIMEGGQIVQIGTPEDLVMRPATDYVRRFVAKVSPARVVKVSSLMERGPAAVGAISGVQADATIAEIAPVLVSGPQAIPVIDKHGRPVGMLNRARALETLATNA
jgi:glycine betaine/proline transport system ATP-binding protein